VYVYTRFEFTHNVLAVHSLCETASPLRKACANVHLYVRVYPHIRVWLNRINYYLRITRFIRIFTLIRRVWVIYCLIISDFRIIRVKNMVTN